MPRRAWHELGCPYEEAIVLAWHGDEPAQLTALEIMQQLGATGRRERAAPTDARKGVLKIPRGSRATTRSHPQGLTKREVQVLELLAQGMRNAAIAKRLFLSTKTVDHHVSAILTKLGVPSREGSGRVRAQQEAGVGGLPAAQGAARMRVRILP